MTKEYNRYFGIFLLVFSLIGICLSNILLPKLFNDTTLQQECEEKIEDKLRSTIQNLTTEKKIIDETIRQKDEAIKELEKTYDETFKTYSTVYSEETKDLIEDMQKLKLQNQLYLQYFTSLEAQKK